MNLPHTDLTNLTNLTKKRVASPALVGFAERFQRHIRAIAMYAS